MITLPCVQADEVDSVGARSKGCDSIYSEGLGIEIVW
jgi:hypothetical protein